MADITNSIVITFKGVNNQLQGSIKGVNSSFVRLQSTITGLQASTQAFTASARRGFLLLAAAITATLVPFSRFEDGMANVITLLSGTNDELEDVKASLDSLAKETLRNTKFSIGDITKSLFDLISALGFTKDTADIFRASQRLAIAGVTDLNTAVIAITSSLNAYKGELTDAERVAKIFFVGQKFGATTVERLAINMGKISPIAKQAGFSLEETVAAVSQLTLGGLNTEIAVTALKNAIAKMLNPTKEAEDAFNRLGIPFGATALKGVSMAEALERIALAARDGGAGVSEMFGNIRAQTAIASLGIKSLENYNFILNEIRTDTESLNRAVVEQEKTFSTAMAKLRNSFSLFAITLGTKMSPEVIKISKNLRTFALVIEQLQPETIDTIAKSILGLAGAFLGLTIAGTVASSLLAIAKVLTIIGVIVTSPAFLGIAGIIGGITAAMIKFQDTRPVKFFKDFGNSLLEAVKAWFEWENLKKEFGFGGDDKKKEGKNFLSFLDSLKAAAADLGDTWKNLGSVLGGPLSPTEEGGDKPSVTEGAEQVQAEVENIGQTTAKVFKGLQTEIVDDWTDTISGLLQGTKTFGDAVMGMFGAIGRAFANLVAEIAASNLFRFGLSLLTGDPFAFKLPSFAVGSSNVPQNMMANIHKGEIITPARESQGIRDGNLALVNTSKLQGQSNDLLQTLVAGVSSLADRPVQVFATFGEAQMDLVSREMDDAKSRREEFLI